MTENIVVNIISLALCCITTVTVTSTIEKKVGGPKQYYNSITSIHKTKRRKINLDAIMRDMILRVIVEVFKNYFQILRDKSTFLVFVIYLRAQEIARSKHFY